MIATKLFAATSRAISTRILVKSSSVASLFTTRITEAETLQQHRHGKINDSSSVHRFSTETKDSKQNDADVKSPSIDAEFIFVADDNSDEEQDGDLPPDFDASKYTTEHDMKFPAMDGDDDDVADSGRVVKWYKKEGSIIRRNDTICDVELETFTFGMDSDDEGITIMGKIHVAGGENAELVKPHTPICTILHLTPDEAET